MQENTHGINITPLVDVSLVLVLIFMVTMPLAMNYGIDVRRQTLKKYGLTARSESISLHVASSGLSVKIGRSEKAIPAEDAHAVVAGLIEQSSSKRVLLSVDRDVPHGTAVNVLDMAKQSGAADIAFVDKG